MPLALVNGFSLNYEIIPNKAVTPVVFIHGNLSSNRWWNPTLEHWRDRDFAMDSGDEATSPIVLFEWRGCGKSQHPQSRDELNMESLAADVVGLLRYLEIERCHVVGHSTGGLISLLAMHLAPSLFERAVLLDPVSPWGITFGSEILQAFQTMRTQRVLLETWLMGALKCTDQNDLYLQQLADDAMQMAPANWDFVLPVLSETDVSHIVPRIAHPTLILHGDADLVLPLEQSEKLASLLPNGMLTVLPNCGHCANLEDPKRFAKFVQFFLFAAHSPEIATIGSLPNSEPIQSRDAACL